MTDLADNVARRRIVTEFGTSFFVEAAAGTGKTSALVDRIVALVRTGGSTLDRVVAVTFTEKAAGEMKLRLRSEIEKARARVAPEERDRLERALEHLELARIGTIHAFCGDLLHERPVEAGIDPLFEVASEETAEALADEAFEAWFQRTLADPPEGVRRILRRRSGMQSPREQMRSAMQSLREHRDFPEPWRRDPFDRNAAIDRLMHELAQLGELAAASSWPDDYLTRNLAEIARFVGETARIEAVRVATMTASRRSRGGYYAVRPGFGAGAGKGPNERPSALCPGTRSWPAATKPKPILRPSSRPAMRTSRRSFTTLCRRPLLTIRFSRPKRDSLIF